jgi:hypothetical protein
MLFSLVQIEVKRRCKIIVGDISLLLTVNPAVVGVKRDILFVDTETELVVQDKRVLIIGAIHYSRGCVPDKVICRVVELSAGVCTDKNQTKLK